MPSVVIVFASILADVSMRIGEGTFSMQSHVMNDLKLTETSN